MEQYTTSADELPELPNEEVTIQVTNEDTKEIFETRAKIAEESDELVDPAPLTVVRGPHENVKEQWYIEIIDTPINDREIDTRILRKSINQAQEESNIVSTRSDDLRSLLEYLVETGEYTSVSEGVREILLSEFSENHIDLVKEYAKLRTEMDRDHLDDMLRRENQ